MAMQAADLATKKWIRLVPNMSLGAYDVLEATGELGEPEWPALTFEQIFTLAFNQDRVIRSFDHPVIRRLRGQI